MLKLGPRPKHRIKSAEQMQPPILQGDIYVLERNDFYRLVVDS